MPNLMFVQAYSPLHAGTGQGSGVIDLPIARERPTNLPILPGSSLKGALRATCEDKSVQQRQLFGPPTSNASDHAGAVQFGDQTLLMLPVRSLAGTFAYVTCPFVLTRFARDARLAGLTPPAIPAPGTEELLRGKATDLVVQVADGRIVLEDLDFKSRDDASSAAWATWIGELLFPDALAEATAQRSFLAKRFAVVADDIFHYLAEHATEVAARIKLDEEKKTVKTGGLWYEESLPAESVLWGLVHAESVRAASSEISATEALKQTGELVTKLGMLQLGGKATVGRGVCRLQWAGV